MEFKKKNYLLNKVVQDVPDIIRIGGSRFEDNSHLISSLITFKRDADMIYVYTLLYAISLSNRWSRTKK